jgi:hypothetical protein
MPNLRNRPRAGNGLVGIITYPMCRIWEAGEAGVLPYVYVTSLDDTLRAAADHGAELVTPPYPEGTLSIATIRDPGRQRHRRLAGRATLIRAGRRPGRWPAVR